MTAAFILRQAAGIIRERGWCQGKLFDGIKCCVAGAMGQVSPVGDVEEHWKARKILTDQIGPSWGEWNDVPSRTVDEVLEMLERAAKMAEAS